MAFFHPFESYERANAVLGEGLRDGVFPGFVAGVWSLDYPNSFEFAWGGHRRMKSKGLAELPMERDTIFDLASLTKVFATSALAMTLIERGWIQWDTPVRSILPNFRHAGVTLKHLASHTSGLPAWYPLFEKMRESFHRDDLETLPIKIRQEAMRKLVFGIDLERSVGTKAVYSDLGFLTLGFALEEVTGLPLDQAVMRFVWRPMGLSERGRTGPYFVHTNQAVFRARDDRVAATEDSAWRHGVIQGQVHDDNCWAMGGYGGHAGAFGTAEDLLLYGKKFFSGYFSRMNLQAAWTRVADPGDCERTPGWDTPSGNSPAFGKTFSSKSVGHLGFTGTSFWIDPENGKVVTLLTNRVHPTRENTLIKSFRGKFHEALATDLRVGLD